MAVLTRRERNDIFEALNDKGVDPARCKLRLKHEPDSGTIEIRDVLTRSWFRFTLLLTEYGLAYNVPDGPAAAGYEVKQWGNVLEQLEYWASEVAYVTSTPDLWAELQQMPEVLTAAQAADASNASFTPDEQAGIGRHIDEIKQLVREQFELTSEQLAAIDQRLDDGKESSKRLGRKDWLMAFYGGLISTVMTDEIPPHVIQTIVSTVVSGISHLFGIGGPPPILGP
jgi:hypothetical protein